jgi:hypothetical protein
MPDINVSIDKTSLAATVESIKRQRAKMLCNCGPYAYMFLHRDVEIEHTDETCICDPVFISQGDFRPSVYFANEILKPVIH